MPIAEQVRVDTHTGNGSSTNFAYGFKIFTDEELLVVVDDVVQTLTTDYTVNGAGDPAGGSIDFVTAPINLSVVTLSGDLEYKRDTDFIENGGMRSGTVDDDLDKVTILLQQLRREVKRSIKVPIEETTDQEVSLTAAERALKVLSFDSGGNPTAQPIADLSSILSSVDGSLTLAAAVLSVTDPNRFVAAGGTVDALTATLSPAPGSLTNGLHTIIEAAGANATTTPTLDANGLGAKTIVKGSDTALLAGDIPGANAMLYLVFDATLDKWVLLNPSLMVDAAAKANVQSGSYRYVVATGAVNVMVAAFSPTILAYTNGMEVTIRVNNANTIAAPTVNIDTLGAKTIKHKDGSALAIGDLPLNYDAKLKYDGTDFLFQNPENQMVIGISGMARNLVIIPNSGTPTTSLDVDADEIMLLDTNGRGKLALSANHTIDATTTGLNALDTGSLAVDTWYHVFEISNGTTDGAILSLSSTAPTLPTGYTFKAYIGVVLTNGSSQFISFRQEGKRVDLDANVNIKDGTFTINAWTDLDMTAVFPPTAKRIRVAFGTDNSAAEVGLSPRSDGAAGAYISFPSNTVAVDYGGAMPTARENHGTMEIRYASTCYYHCRDAGCSLVGLGWDL